MFLRNVDCSSPRNSRNKPWITFWRFDRVNTKLVVKVTFDTKNGLFLRRMNYVRVFVHNTFYLVHLLDGVLIFKKTTCTYSITSERFFFNKPYARFVFFRNLSFLIIRLLATIYDLYICAISRNNIVCAEPTEIRVT